MNQQTVTAARLAVMMFIQFCIWGAWYVTAPVYLAPRGFTPENIGSVYAMGPLAGIISPFIVGLIADRFFSTERVLGVLHLAGAVVMYLIVSTINIPEGEILEPATINQVITYILIYQLCYFPTLALTNSLAMKNITDTEKIFPLVRVFGTIGWIVVGVLIGKMDWGDTVYPFAIAAISSVTLGIYSFTLPHTPPPMAGKKVSAGDLLGLKALVLLKNPSYLIFMISSFLICIPLAFYYQIAAYYIETVGVEEFAFKMTFGQMSEIFFMVAMPLFFARLGVKKMLLFGMVAWVARYGLFAFGLTSEGEPILWMLIAGILLHGICYDFFFVTGQIYTDKVAGPEIRSQAQGLLVLFTLGIGMMIGAKVAGTVQAYYTVDDVVNWKGLWMVPTAASAVVLVIFALLFKDAPVEETKTADSEEPAEE